ncbi:MAG: PEP-CTERM sorting domain-containing protein [Phycisphaerae bacterium]
MTLRISSLALSISALLTATAWAELPQQAAARAEQAGAPSAGMPEDNGPGAALDHGLADNDHAGLGRDVVGYLADGLRGQDLADMIRMNLPNMTTTGSAGMSGGNGPGTALEHGLMDNEHAGLGRDVVGYLADGLRGQDLADMIRMNLPSTMMTGLTGMPDGNGPGAALDHGLTDNEYAELGRFVVELLAAGNRGTDLTDVLLPRGQSLDGTGDSGEEAALFSAGLGDAGAPAYLSDGVEVGASVLDEPSSFLGPNDANTFSIVPEPGTLSLLAVGAICLMRRKR